MKKICILICLVSASLSICGQTKLSPAQEKQVIEKIDKSASDMKSMQCDFVQTKSMKMLKRNMESKGVMYFKRENKLRWQYTTPYDYTFILNGDNIRLKSSKSDRNINMQGNKMFSKITNLILNSVTGGGLKNTKDFSFEVYQTDNKYFAKLYPKKKEIKQLYSVIEIYFNDDLTMVNSVKMSEKTGDTTVVKLINIKKNVAIDEKFFKTN